jgi:hypothetical protein
MKPGVQSPAPQEKEKRAGGVDQGVDQLPCKHKALSSNSQKIKKKNDKE